MIFSLILVLLLLSAGVFATLPDRSWVVLGPNVAVALLQLALGILVVEALLRRHTEMKQQEVIAGVLLSPVTALLLKLFTVRLANYERPIDVRKAVSGISRGLAGEIQEIRNAAQPYTPFLAIETTHALTRLQEDADSLVHTLDLKDEEKFLSESRKACDVLSVDLQHVLHACNAYIERIIPPGEQTKRRGRFNPRKYLAF